MGAGAKIGPGRGSDVRLPFARSVGEAALTFKFGTPPQELARAAGQA